MGRHLSIRNFGAIRSAEIELKDFNIFIGEQGSGKSTIAKLMTIFSQQTGNNENDPNLMAQITEFNMVSYFQQTMAVDYRWEGGEINLQFEDPTIKKSGNVPANASQTLYIPAERSFVGTFSRSLATLVLNKVPIPGTLLEFASLYEKAKKKYPNYNIPLFGMTFQTNETSETLHLQNSNTIIPFKDASSGMQSVIPLLMVIDYATSEGLYDRYIIEEPELNLFPQTQVDLLHFLVSRCRQLTVTTHSPYLLSGLNTLIEANNVLKLHPEKEDEIAALIPKECMMDFDNVGAYKIEDGEILSIMNSEYHLVVADKIDEISDRESRIFSALLDME